MLWYRNLGVTEIIFIAAFVAFYVFYVIRIIRIAKQLKTPYGNVFVKLFFRTLYFALVHSRAFRALIWRLKERS